MMGARSEGLVQRGYYLWRLQVDASLFDCEVLTVCRV